VGKGHGKDKGLLAVCLEGTEALRMISECSICHETIAVNDEPPVVSPSGAELVSHGMHSQCALAYYGEDFSDILEGEPT
jgi:hypothetical protein